MRTQRKDLQLTHSDKFSAITWFPVPRLGIHLDWPMNFRRCHQLSWKYFLQPGNNAQQEPQGNPTIQHYVWRLHVSFGHAACWTKIQISPKSCHAFAILCGTTARDIAMAYPKILPAEHVRKASPQKCCPKLWGKTWSSKLHSHHYHLRNCFLEDCTGRYWRRGISHVQIYFSSKSQLYDHITNLHMTDACNTARVFFSRIHVLLFMIFVSKTAAFHGR